MKWYQKLEDYSFCYIVAWMMIITFPLWLPVWLAVKIYREGDDEKADTGI